MSPYEISKITWDTSWCIRVEVSCPDGTRVYKMTADDFIQLSHLGKELFFIPSKHPTEESETGAYSPQTPDCGDQEESDE